MVDSALRKVSSLSEYGELDRYITVTVNSLE